MRTTVGLLLAGVNPRDCNLSMDDTTIPYIRECFEKGKISMNKNLVWVWEDIQNRIPAQIKTDIAGSRELLRWLSTYDFTQYRENRIRHFFWNLGLLFRGGRIKLPYLKRKIKCYCYIVLARLKLV
jgi:hypothetical protein